MIPARKFGNRQRKSGNIVLSDEPALKMQKMSSTSGDFVVTSSYTDETCHVEKENIAEQKSKIEIKSSKTEEQATTESGIPNIKEKNDVIQKDVLPEPLQNQSASTFCKGILQELLEYILPE
ncbi:unnamed protein product [Oikopleura dioica]|uniref:Uncharacterized protein n=1 Tax=Oikopleura dioica TaxID=34765 RepID=E4WV15_OIKDI|nr:unnamed protein product [Oikopleura dioica]CBY41915.1 unnamed protein product [Oikopleura dioica]